MKKLDKEMLGMLGKKISFEDFEAIHQGTAVGKVVAVDEESMVVELIKNESDFTGWKDDRWNNTSWKEGNITTIEGYEFSTENTYWWVYFSEDYKEVTETTEIKGGDMNA